MTSRFDPPARRFVSVPGTRLSKFDQMLLITLIAATSTFLFPYGAAAQSTSAMASANAENQNAIVFEIKNLQAFTFPKTTDNADTTDGADDEAAQVTAIAPPPTPTPAPIVKKPVVRTTTITYKNLPPKTTGSAKTYMQEPEIRAYVCPKLGDRCNTFIAILAAENGTHECTRDNRGVNKNGTVDVGLAQINWNSKSPYSFEQLQDCKFNLDIALQKIKTRGFQPWSAYNKGAYLRHLPAILASAKVIAAAETAPVIIQN